MNESRNLSDAGETCEFTGISVWVADVVMPVGGLATFAGWSLNIIILWVLLTNKRHPIDTLQINQCVGDVVDVTLGLPLLITARYFWHRNFNWAGLFYNINVTHFMINYTFKCFVSILSIAKRTAQICHNSREEFHPRSINVTLVTFWLLSLSVPLYVLVRNTLRLISWNWEQKDSYLELDLTSDILKGLLVFDFLATTFFMAVCHVKIWIFLRKHENNVRLAQFRTWHLKRSANTLLISLVVILCSQVTPHARATMRPLCKALRMAFFSAVSVSVLVSVLGSGSEYLKTFPRVYDGFILGFKVTIVTKRYLVIYQRGKK